MNFSPLRLCLNHSSRAGVGRVRNGSGTCDVRLAVIDCCSTYQLLKRQRAQKDRAWDTDSRHVLTLLASDEGDTCSRGVPSCASHEVSWLHQWTGVFHLPSKASIRLLQDKMRQVDEYTKQLQRAHVGVDEQKKTNQDKIKQWRSRSKNRQEAEWRHVIVDSKLKRRECRTQIALIVFHFRHFSVS